MARPVAAAMATIIAKRRASPRKNVVASVLSFYEHNRVKVTPVEGCELLVGIAGKGTGVFVHNGHAGMKEVRAMFAEAKAHGVQRLALYARTCTYISDSFTFSHIGLRGNVLTECG